MQFKSNSTLSSTLTVIDSIFQNNYANGYGAGLLINGTFFRNIRFFHTLDVNTTVTNCDFTNNFVSDTKCQGGGINIVNSPYYQTIVLNSTFQLNRGCYGSAIAFTTWPYVSSTVLPNIVQYCTFDSQQRGTDLWMNNTSIDLSYSSIRNSSSQAIYMSNSFNNTINHVLVTSNYTGLVLFFLFFIDNTQGITCANAGFTLLESSVFNNNPKSGDITCNFCFISGQWTGAECALNKCNRYQIIIS